MFCGKLPAMKKALQQKFKDNPATTTSLITVAMVIILVVAKSVALWVSGSAAVLSALIDSLSDVGLSAMTLISVRWSVKPPDDDHRHGHGKVEGIAALLQASMLLGGGAFLVLEAMGRFLHPVEMSRHLFTLALMALSVVISIAIAKVQKLGAEHSNSLAVEADATHYSADVIINGSVFVIILVDYLNIFGHWIDPVCAIGVAGIMARAAYQIAIKAFGMLLDAELPSDVRNRIIAKIRSHPDVLGLHDLRTTQSGMRELISFDIEVEPSLSLQEAHEISRKLEDALLLDFPNAEVMIHIDPAGDTRDSRHRHHHGHIEGSALHG